MANVLTGPNLHPAEAGELQAHSQPHIGDVALRATAEAPREPLGVEARDAILPTKWWEGTKVEAELDDSLYEVFQAHLEGEGEEEPLASMDILNCSPIPLSAADREAVQHTIKKVSDFTQGKIFSRVKGIVFSSGDKFSNKNLGGYVPSGGYLRINIDELRKEQGDELAPRYKRYFKDQPNMGTFEVNLAHEFGHPMDVHTDEEAAASELDVKKVWNPGLGGSMHNVSAFHGNVGWKHSVQDHESGLFGKVDQWDIDDAVMSERGEYPPTNYAATLPGEDFAESFAIAALDGDTSTLEVRTSAIKKVIDAAEGTAYPQAAGVALDRLAG